MLIFRLHCSIYKSNDLDDIMHPCKHLLETVSDPTLHSDVGFAVHIETLNNIQQLSHPPYSNGLSTFHNASLYSAYRMPFEGQ